MKSIRRCVAILSLILLGVGCSQEKANQVAVVITSDSHKKATLSVSDLSVTDIAKGELTDGVFAVKTTLPRTTFYSLSMDDKYICQLYLANGDDLKINIVGGEVTFEGKTAEQNQFLRQLSAFRSELMKEYPLDLILFDSYFVNTMMINDRMDEFVDKNYSKKDDFAENVKLENRLRNNSSLLTLRSSVKSIFGVDVKIPSEKFEFLRSMKFDKENYASVSFIQNYLQNYFNVMEQEGFIDGDIENFPLKRLAYISNEKIKEEYVLNLLERELYGYNQELPSVIERVRPFVVSESGKLKLTEIEQKQTEIETKYSGLKSGEAAFDFEAMDENGVKRKLSDYAGSVVVVDVWSTNCIPCIQEMPYLHELEKKFEKMPVVFISYSIDTDVKRWNSFREKENLHGIQLIDTMQRASQMVKNYLIHSTPRLMVIDTEGKIVTTFAPKPSDPRLELIIKKLL